MLLLSFTCTKSDIALAYYLSKFTIYLFLILLFFTYFF
nr:MAG TPA: hypothetical protein [Caudoviricetes sp.]